MTALPITLALVLHVALCWVSFTAYRRSTLLLTGVMIFLWGWLVSHSTLGSLNWLLLSGLLTLEAIFLVFTNIIKRDSWRFASILHPAMLPFAVAACFWPTQAGEVYNTSALLYGHLITGVIGFSGFATAALAAVVVLVRMAYLEAHASSTFSEKLPSLQTAEKIESYALWVAAAFVMLTLTFGELRSIELAGHVTFLKKGATYLLLLITLLLLVARAYGGMWGRGAARLTLIVFVISAFLMFGHRVYLASSIS